MNLGIGFGCFLAGVISWTFAEYLLHRGVGHDTSKKNPFTIEHVRHHRDTNYFASTYKKVLAALGVLSVTTLLLGLFTNWFMGLSFSLGLSAMYLVYELLHRRAHTHRPRGQYGRWLRKHHFHHHFKNPFANHGVTSPLWDIVFGTLETPKQVEVPRKVVLDWMIAPETGEILPGLQEDYTLRDGTTASI